MSEAEELRAELARLWDAVASVLPPQKGARVTATVSHPEAGIPKGQVGNVYEVNGRTRLAYFSASAMCFMFDVTDPRCGVEWGR